MSRQINEIAQKFWKLLKFSHGPAIMHYLQAHLMEWFDILRTFIGADGYFIHHHSSLLPLNNRPAVFMKTFKFILKDLWEKNQGLSSTVCNAVPLFYGFKMWYWYDIVENSTGLEPWFDFKTCPRIEKFYFNCIATATTIKRCHLHAFTQPNVWRKMHKVLWAVDMLKQLKLEENFKDWKSFFLLGHV